MTPATKPASRVVAIRVRKARIGDAPRHIDGLCECDCDADERGYFECSTDPRCAALRGQS